MRNLVPIATAVQAGRRDLAIAHFEVALIGNQQAKQLQLSSLRSRVEGQRSMLKRRLSHLLRARYGISFHYKGRVDAPSRF